MRGFLPVSGLPSMIIVTGDAPPVLGRTGKRPKAFGLGLKFYLKKRDFENAQIHANVAAQSGAAWGMLIAVFGNVGNFGLPIVRFRFPGDQAALATATIYFLAIMIIAFIICVAAANWHRAGSIRAVVAVFKTPALLAVPPALLVNWANLNYGVSLPPIMSRPIELLSAAMIPTMVVALGCQLAGAGIPRPNWDMAISSAIRLLGGPLLAFGLAAPFGLVGIERSVGILQASMPAAVLVSIIAVENDLLPEFVIATVLFSTLASVVTLTIVLTLL